MVRTTLGIAAVLLLAAGTVQAGGGGELPFTRDVAEGMDLAKRTGKPFVLYFTADW